MNKLIAEILVLLALLLAATSFTRAQINTTVPVPYATTSQIPELILPLPPTDHWELEYWSCIPSSCSDIEGPVYNGAVQTSGTGLCFNGYTVNVYDASCAIDCTSPVLLETGVDSVLSTITAFDKKYELEGLNASGAVIDADGVPDVTSFALTWCNGITTTSGPSERTC